jgi:hypothetical protein
MENILNHLIVVILDISLWQGRKKLRPEDLAEKGVDVKSLPPEKLASLGSKRIVAPDAVNSFMALKRRAERACLSVGVKTLGGFGIPEDKLPTLKAELDEIMAEFAVDKAKFMSEYEVTIAAWVEENPEWKSAILRAIDPAERVSAQMQARYTVFRLGAAAGAVETLEEEVHGLYAQLQKEIAYAAKSAWEESYQGKLSVTQKALSPLKKAVEKLKGLSFLDGDVCVLANSVESVIKSIGSKTPIEGADLLALNGVLATLMSLDRVKFSVEVEAAEFAATPPQPEPEVADVVIDTSKDAEQWLPLGNEPPTQKKVEIPSTFVPPPVQKNVQPAAWF